MKRVVIARTYEIFDEEKLKAACVRIHEQWTSPEDARAIVNGRAQFDDWGWLIDEVESDGSIDPAEAGYEETDTTKRVKEV